MVMHCICLNSHNLLLNNGKAIPLNLSKIIINGKEIIKWKMYFKISVRFSTDVLKKQERRLIYAVSEN